ncbi:MAG: adenylate/guanylate cyclase domain-containing protein, partial [Pseudomonadota bacterium]
YEPLWGRLSPIADTVAFVAGYQWIWWVRQTIPAGELKTRFGDGALRVAQGLALVYLAFSLLWPELRFEFFTHKLFSLEALTSFHFYLFAAPLEFGLLLAMASIGLTLNRRPDRAEQVRLVAFLLAAPFMASAMVLPHSVAPIATVVGLLVLLIGAVRFHVLQGQRGVFLSRFLSPNVASLVNRKGLRGVMADANSEISIVCADIRHFTRFASATESDKVIQLLREYYDAVGEVVTEYEGTIKDYAGDGILVLIGAPLPVADHAAKAVRMAAGIRAAGDKVVARWQTPEHPLGIGVGLASGPVTVGVIGGKGRLEYAAVGPAVNLASRLCESAQAGQIVADDRTRELALAQDRALRFEPREALSVKGFEEPVLSFHFGRSAPLPPG